MTFAVPAQLLPTYMTLRGALAAGREAATERLGAGAASAPARPRTAVPAARAAQRTRVAARRMGLLGAGIDTRPTSHDEGRYDRAVPAPAPSSQSTPRRRDR